MNGILLNQTSNLGYTMDPAGNLIFTDTALYIKTNQAETNISPTNFIITDGSDFTKITPNSAILSSNKCSVNEHGEMFDSLLNTVIGSHDSNISTNFGSNSIIGSLTSNIQGDSENSIILGGVGHLISEGVGSIILGGEGLKTTTRNQIVIGEYNAPSSAILVLGNGTSNSRRNNSFTLSAKGDIKTSGTISSPTIDQIHANYQKKINTDVRSYINILRDVTSEPQTLTFNENTSLSASTVVSNIISANDLFGNNLSNISISGHEISTPEGMLTDTSISLEEYYEHNTTIRAYLFIKYLGVLKDGKQSFYAYFDTAYKPNYRGEWDTNEPCLYVDIHCLTTSNGIKTYSYEIVGNNYEFGSGEDDFTEIAFESDYKLNYTQDEINAFLLEQNKKLWQALNKIRQAGE